MLFSTVRDVGSPACVNSLRLSKKASELDGKLNLFLANVSEQFDFGGSFFPFRGRSLRSKQSNSSRG